MEHSKVGLQDGCVTNARRSFDVGLRSERHSRTVSTNDFPTYPRLLRFIPGDASVHASLTSIGTALPLPRQSSWGTLPTAHAVSMTIQQ